MENIDPKLIANYKKIHSGLASTFDDPKFQRINDPNIKNYFGFKFAAEQFNKLDHLEDLRNKANGIFGYFDVFSANALRFSIGWFEGFAYHLGNASQISQRISQLFLRNFFAGSISTASLLGANSIAAQSTSQKDVSPVSFWLHANLWSILFAPVTAFATQIFSNGAINNAQAFRLQFHPSRLLSNALFSGAIVLYNSNNQLVNYLYYPAVVASAFYYRKWTYYLHLENIEEAIVKKTGSQPSADFFGRFFKSSLVKPSGDLTAIAALSLMNFLLPIALPQFKPREEYRAAYLDYVRTESGQKHRKPRYE